MELWIRSQDKKVLISCRKLCVSGTYGNEIIENDIGSLGIYKSKERALEVLDEIQYKIKNMYILENCKLPKKSCIERSLAMDNFNIYEMPKE